MNAVSILQTVLNNVSLDMIEPDLSSSHPSIRRILTLMNNTGTELARRCEWSFLSQTTDIPIDTDAFPLPEDFHRISEKGTCFLLREGFHPVRFVAAPEQWAFLTRQSSIHTYAHIMGGQIVFSPPLTLYPARLRYVSKYWVHDQNKDPKDAITHSDDHTLIPGYLIEKGTVCAWKCHHGLSCTRLLAAYEAAIASEMRADRGLII